MTKIKILLFAMIWMKGWNPFGYGQNHPKLFSNWVVVGQQALCLDSVFDSVDPLVLIPINHESSSRRDEITEASIDEASLTIHCANGAGNDRRYISGSAAVIIRSRIVIVSSGLTVLELANSCRPFSVNWRGDSLFLRRINAESIHLKCYDQVRHLGGASFDKQVFDQIAYLSKRMNVQNVNIVCYPSSTRTDRKDLPVGQQYWMNLAQKVLRQLRKRNRTTSYLIQVKEDRETPGYGSIWFEFQ